MALAILAGRLSDRVGRKPMAFTIVALAGICFFLFYNGAPGWAMPPLWILAFFGFFSGDVLIAGFALEIVPTHYRATVSGLRYMVEILIGAVALALEGVLYDLSGSIAPPSSAFWQLSPSLCWPSCSCPNPRAIHWKKWRPNPANAAGVAGPDIGPL